MTGKREGKEEVAGWKKAKGGVRKEEKWMARMRDGERKKNDVNKKEEGKEERKGRW